MALATTHKDSAVLTQTLNVFNRAETSNPFIEFVGAWFDLLPAQSTLGYRQDNSRA